MVVAVVEQRVEVGAVSEESAKSTDQRTDDDVVCMMVLRHLVSRYLARYVGTLYELEAPISTPNKHSERELNLRSLESWRSL